MSKRWRKFNFREWRSDEKLRRCSRDVQAIWLDLCGLIYEAEDMGRLSVVDDGQRRPYTRAELCKITGDDWRVMDRAMRELVQHGVCQQEGGYLVSRRIAREEQRALQDASNGAKGGNPALIDKALGQNGVNPQKPEFQRQEKKEGVVARIEKFDFSALDGDALDALETEVRKWANGSLAPIAGPLNLAPITKLLAGGCTMADVKSGVIAGSTSLHNGGRQTDTLEYFTKPIVRARDDRMKPIPAPEPANGRHERPSIAGGNPGYRGRGPTEDPLDRIRARMGRGQADPDIIEHPAIAERA